MEASSTSTETTLRLHGSFSAPPERVFRAWTDAEELKKWFAPSDEFEIPIAEIDAREGGRYRIEMKQGEESYRVGGTYREVRSPERLVFTWQWEDGPEGEDTIVTVDFRERDGGTELSLTHEPFADDERRERHEQGWDGCLERLAQLL